MQKQAAMAQTPSVTSIQLHLEVDLTERDRQEGPTRSHRKVSSAPLLFYLTEPRLQHQSRVSECSCLSSSLQSSANGAFQRVFICCGWNLLSKRQQRTYCILSTHTEHAHTHTHRVKQYLKFWQPFLHHSLVHSQHVPSSAVESPLPEREKNVL